MSYFSNGTEGEAWTSVWCNRCEHDHEAHTGELDGGGCPLFLASIAGGNRREYEESATVLDWFWRQRNGAPFHLPPDVDCTMFVKCSQCSHPDGRDDEATEYRAAVRARITEAIKIEIRGGGPA